MSYARLLILLASIAASVGCAHRQVIPGTTVVDTEENRRILATVELYRQKLMEKDVEGLLLLASRSYFEDSGTPSAADDYNYDGLRTVLIKHLARVKSVHFDVQYRNIELKQDRANVEVFLNGAFELSSEGGDRYFRVSDYHQFVLERAKGDKWKFVSGM